MDYSDVYRKHFRKLKAMAVDRRGHAVFVLADGKIEGAENPKEADMRLSGIEERHD